MLRIFTVEGQELKLTVDAAADFRSMIAMEKQIATSVFRVLEVALESRSIIEDIQNIVMLETLGLDKLGTVHMTYHMGFNLPVTSVKELHSAQLDMENKTVITGMVEQVDVDLVRFRRFILVKPKSIDAQNVNGNQFDETLAIRMQALLNEYKGKYPDRPTMAKKLA